MEGSKENKEDPEKKIPYQRKKIEGFEWYEIDTNGVVYSNHGKRADKIIPQNLDKLGYPRVNLSLNGKNFTPRVHKLVAQAFLPNPNNYREVNHKDSNKQNNCVDNLEWCSRHYNMQQVADEVYSGKRESTYYLDIYCYKPFTGELVKKYRSLIEAVKDLGLPKNRRCGIGSVLRGTARTSCGYVWSLEKLSPSQVKEITNGNGVEYPGEDFYGYSILTGELVCHYKNFKELLRDYSYSKSKRIFYKIRNDEQNAIYLEKFWSFYKLTPLVVLSKVEQSVKSIKGHTIFYKHDADNGKLLEKMTASMLEKNYGKNHARNIRAAITKGTLYSYGYLWVNEPLTSEEVLERRARRMNVYD